jgi:hypothetical protein
MIIFAVILLIVAGCCFFAARGRAARLRAIDATDTFTAQMLQELYKRVVSELGGEALAKQCEVEGVIEAEAPLTAPLSNTACVAYTRLVTREYEEDITSTDAAGKRTTETQRRSETVENDDRRVNFFVRDATGRVLINPEQAELDLAQTGNRFEPDQTAARARTRTIGHRYQESALAVGTRVYVLGCVVDGQGQPLIARNPHDEAQKFIVSRRGERELANATASAARNWYYASIGSGVLGLVLLILGLVQ